MLLPNGIGNLQKGERLVGLNFVSPSFVYFLHQVRQHGLSAITLFQQLVIIVGYDIACQWYTNLLKRIEMDWPEELRLHGIETRPVIGKLHEPAH